MREWIRVGDEFFELCQSWDVSSFWYLLWCTAFDFVSVEAFCDVLRWFLWALSVDFCERSALILVSVERWFLWASRGYVTLCNRFASVDALCNALPNFRQRGDVSRQACHEAAYLDWSLFAMSWRAIGHANSDPEICCLPRTTAWLWAYDCVLQLFFTIVCFHNCVILFYDCMCFTIVWFCFTVVRVLQLHYFVLQLYMFYNGFIVFHNWTSQLYDFATNDSFTVGLWLCFRIVWLCFMTICGKAWLLAYHCVLQLWDCMIVFQDSFTVGS